MTNAARSAIVARAVQAVVPQTEPETPPPWERRPFKQVVCSRVKEIVYQGLSWPYLVSMYLTYMSSIGRADWSWTLGMWGIAFGVRIASTMAQGKAVAWMTRPDPGPPPPGEPI